MHRHIPFPARLSSTTRGMRRTWTSPRRSSCCAYSGKAVTAPGCHRRIRRPRGRGRDPSAPEQLLSDAALIKGIADAYERLETTTSNAARSSCAQRESTSAPAPTFPDPLEDQVSPNELYAQAIRLFRSTKPVVAAVQGAAIGGGLGLALSADFRVAAPSSKFAANFSRLGVSSRLRDYRHTAARRGPAKGTRVDAHR